MTFDSVGAVAVGRVVREESDLAPSSTTAARPSSVARARAKRRVLALRALLRALDPREAQAITVSVTRRDGTHTRAGFGSAHLAYALREALRNCLLEQEHIAGMDEPTVERKRLERRTEFLKDPDA